MLGCVVLLANLSGYAILRIFCSVVGGRNFQPLAGKEVKRIGYLQAANLIVGLQTSETALPDNTKSDNSIALANTWITECSTGHKQCSEKSIIPSSKWYPTRLLEIDSPGSGSNFRLIETRNSNLEGPYMTLSHCWGFKDCTILETENYAEMLHGRPLESLPQLYQDAAYVTRRLGARYLWIDSLCIIQKGDGLAD